MADEPRFEHRDEPATPVSGDFTVRCPECGSTASYNDDNLREQHREAAAEKNEPVASEIREALEAWGVGA